MIAFASPQVLEPGVGFTGARVAELLERAAKGHLPKVITADNGTEFTSKALDAWAFEHGVKLDFTTPGKPTENGFVESFQGRFRDECLNTEIFDDIAPFRSFLSWAPLLSALYG
jgi:putative transposase